MLNSSRNRWPSSVRFTGHPEWPDTAAAEAGESGLVIVVVARERGSSVRVCEFLVDTWCLGVKNAPGPKPVERRKLPSFTSASGIGFAVGFAMFGALAYLPQYMQVVRGLSATLSGLRLLRMMAGVPATGKILYRPVRLTSWPVPMEVSRTSSDTPRRLPCLRSGAPSWSGIRTATFTCRRAVTRRPVPVSRAAP